MRMILMDGSKHPEGVPTTWMGDSRGRWEGDTLVVDVKNFNIRPGSIARGIITATRCMWWSGTRLPSPDHILYEVTIEDPKVFSRPWKMSMPIYRRLEKNVKLLEYECVFFLQEESTRTLLSNNCGGSRETKLLPS